MGVLNRLTRRSNGARRFSLVAATTASAGAAAPAAPAASVLAAPAGVAVMPLALRAGALAALSRAERVARSVTEPFPAVLPAAASDPAAAAVACSPAATGYAVLDVVTSGLSPEHDRLLEVAVVQLDADGAVVGEWSSLLRPSVLADAYAGESEHPGSGTTPPDAIPPHATRADLAVLAATVGVTVAELAAAPTLAEVAGELVAAMTGRVLVAHGVTADLAFLRAELARAGVVLPLAPVLCTLEASWRHLPALTRRRLVDCCQGAGVALDGLPAALTDARAAAGLLQRYLARTGERGDAQVGLVARAAAVAWPQVEVPPMSCAAARSGTQPSLADAPGRLAVVLESLPLAGPELPLPAVAGHVELLVAALSAGPLDERSVRALALLADAANLTRAQVRAASRGVVLALATAVGRSAGAGEAERAEVMTAARALAVDLDDVATAMAAAAVATGSLPVVDVRADLRAGASSVARVALPEIPVPRTAAAHPKVLDEGEHALLDLTAPDVRATVRAWGRQHGFPISDRGRLPRSVVEAYEAARAV